MSSGQNKRKIKEKEKFTQNSRQKDEEDLDDMLLNNNHHDSYRKIKTDGMQIIGDQLDLLGEEYDDHNSEQEEDEQFYRNKDTRIVNINLYLELPQESQHELLKCIPAIFIDTTGKFSANELEPQKQPSKFIGGSTYQETINNNNNYGNSGITLGQEFRLRLADIIKYLKIQGYSLENVYVSYYSQIFSAYINCNLDPIPKTIWLGDNDFEVIDGQKSLRLKFQRGIGRQFREEDQKDNESISDDGTNIKTNGQQNLQDGRRSRRHKGQNNDDGGKNQTNSQHHTNIEPEQKIKERTVGYVIEKVQQWRRLYNGFYDQNHCHKRMSLEEAAEQVNVSKKSLDDYLAQLRDGRQNGYDFNLNKDQKVGHLRRFVKEKKETMNKKQKAKANNGAGDQNESTPQKRRKKNQ